MGRKQIQAPEQRHREYWRPVPGYDGRYQASTEGRIRRVMADGSTQPVRIYDNRGLNKRYHTVKLTRPNGDRQERTVLRVIAETWYPDQLAGDVIVTHRNGMSSDNSAYNVAIMTRQDLTRLRTAGSMRRTVLHLGTQGELLEIYPSMVAAAKATGMSVSAVRQHCIGRNKQRKADGTTYQFEETDKRRKRKG